MLDKLRPRKHRLHQYSNAYQAIIAPDSTISCSSFETQMCSAINVCGGTICEIELGDLFSCGQTCDPIDCLDSATSTPYPIETEGPTMAPECEALLESAKQCVSGSNPACSACIDSAYQQIFAASDSVRNSTAVANRAIQLNVQILPVLQT
jgi:hypothetical protein